MLKKLISCGKEWENILKDFSIQTANKKYKRVSYSTWLTLSKNVKQVTISKPEIDNDTIWLTFITMHDQIPSQLHADDNSFGQFLYDRCLKDEEEKMKQSYTCDSITGSSVSAPYEYISNYGTCETRGTISIPGYSSLVDTLDELTTGLADLQLQLNKKVDIQDFKKKDGNENMKGFNFDFGPCNSNTVKMSMYGLAIKNSAGNWVSYDSASKSIMDVDVLNFDGAKFLYRMPVAISEVKAGDVVVHNGFPMFVLSTSNGGIEVIDPHAGEKKTVLLTKSPFGFDFATKVVNLLSGMTAKSADAANPFGNMWMLMLLGDNKDFSDIAPLMMMQQGGNMDPMMMYFMMSGNKNSDMLPLLFMMNANKNTNTCNCKGACTEVSAN